MGTPLNEGALRTEGDVNVTASRRRWQDGHLDASTREALEEDAQGFMHQSLSTPCLNALSGCEGIYLIDAQGRRIMDFHGNSVHQIGYGHPRVLNSVKSQLDELSFCPRRYTNRPAIELAKKLGTLTPGTLNKVLLTPSGTGAIGIAMKIARYVTGRHKTISMWDSFHGASLDAISIGGEALFRDGLGPLLPDCFHVPWPHTVEDAEAIEEILIKQKDIGAVIAEPMRCTTIERPSDAYWKRVRALCDEHGALLIFDEIPLALGRTGTMFCCEHFGVTPDILVIGKGLGGAVMPIAATIVREDFDVMQKRALGHYTHEKSPIAAAAALATIQVIEEEHLLDHSRSLGAEALVELKALQRRQPVVSKVRGLGLALGIEIGGEASHARDMAESIMYRCLSMGLSFKVSAGNVLTLTPPLVITREQLSRALNIIETAIGECQESI
jgi:4-aminobutyrate aminotransferase